MTTLRRAPLLIPLALMALFNWTYVERREMVSTKGSWTHAIGATVLADLIGLAMIAFLLREIVVTALLLRDQGRLDEKRQNITLYARFMPHPFAFVLVLPLLLGLTYDTAWHAADGACKLVLAIGSSCSLLPLCLAGIVVTLWNVFVGLQNQQLRSVAD